jgi:ankyrin repeat protein
MLPKPPAEPPQPTTSNPRQGRLPRVRQAVALAGLQLVLASTPAVAAGPGLPLVDAVRRGDVKALSALIAQRIDVNLPEVDGTTALHWAVRRGDAPAVEALLRAGANVNAANRYGVTPLSLACVSGSGPIAGRLLTAGADPNSTRPGGETALMSAARAGSLEVVAALLERRADADRKDDAHGQTALMWAAGGNHADVVARLVAAGAGIEVRSKGGFTPLLFAARGGHRAAAQALLDYGANPNASEQGWTALHQIAWTRRPHVGFNNPEPVQRDDFDSLALVRKLIAYGADPNVRMPKALKEEPRTGLSGLNRAGATPFFLAAKDADVDLMRVLAEHGADPLATNVDRTTPLMVAAGVGIFTPGEDPGTNDEAFAAVKLALELGGSVTAVDDKGDTALHGAAARGANPLAQFLAERGAQLDAVNKRGWTPLIIAEGVMLGGTIKRQPETAALLRELIARAAPAGTRP